MTHRFPLKEIARQSGLSTATIDRALNNRAHVSPQTKARVVAAISELEGQEGQLAARGRRLFFDVVIEAPARFSREVQRAAEQVLPRIGEAVCRPRFVMQEQMSEEETANTLARIARRGSNGVCLKARDLPAVRSAVDMLATAGIPVVTLVTDLTGTQRQAYVGLDNQSAGRTAAYLIAKTIGTARGSVLTTRSNDRFLGEEEREAAFVSLLGDLCPRMRIVDLSGDAIAISRSVERIVQDLNDLRGVYSMGGGNHAILTALERHGVQPDIFVAHDLDKDNRSLIEAGQLSFVLHHDLRIDMETVFRALLHHHKLIAERPLETVSNVQVVTPENVPPAPRAAATRAQLKSKG